MSLKTQLGLVLMVLAAGARAATNAVDTAEAYPGWSSGDTGGVAGFGPWILTTTSTNVEENGHFIGNSALNGGGTNAVPDGDINTGGKAWGLYANQGQTAAAVRPFVGGPLVVGQSVSCAMDTGYADGGSAVGVGLQNANGENVVEVLFRGGELTYEVSDASGLHAIPFGYTNDGMVVQITLTSFATYAGSIMPFPSGVATTFSGDLMNPPGGPLAMQARVFAFNTGSGPERDQFFNSLEVTAAPASGDLLPAPRVVQAAVTNGAYVVSWNATNTALYDLQASTDLVASAWAGVPGASNLVSFGATLSLTNAASAPVFYRVWQHES
ncbi:MAG: hypothetical protein K8T26_07245 [Lentisphaerae bacterium]|nr:hypothetical protein [Lentisphaerota bacterium]